VIRRIHLVESGGRGGVFNHSVAVAAGLTGLGLDVVLHTATDHDPADPSVPLCRCIAWHRRSSKRWVRQARTSARYLARTLPHLATRIGARDVVHIQGLFAMTPELIAVARSRRATVVCSPHNTFVRQRHAGGSRAMASALSRADRVLVYADVDRERVSRDAADIGVVPLLQWVPPVDPELRAGWRRSLGAENVKLAVMPGQVRADKNPDVFVEALAGLPGWRGAVVGEDLGPGASLDQRIRDTDAPVTTIYRYLSVDEFTALVAAADVIAAPYSVASQSGVLAVAAALGVPRAVTPVGGLVELATAVARDTTAAALREAILKAAADGAGQRDTTETAKLYLDEYERAVARARHTEGAAG
jgi:glycosyltransferase involved in cell wall biosynthesis